MLVKDLISSLRLTAIGAKQLLKRLELPGDIEEIDNGQTMLLFVIDYLKHATSAFISPESCEAIIDTFGTFIKEAGERIGQCYYLKTEKIPAYNLMIVERKYASVTSSDKLLDLKTGEILRSIGRAPLEVIVYNLSELYIWNVERIKLIKEKLQQAGKDV